MAEEKPRPLTEDPNTGSERKPLAQALGTFSKNLGALRVFVSEIARLADQHDKKVMDEFLKAMKPIFGQDFLEHDDSENRADGTTPERRASDEESRASTEVPQSAVQGPDNESSSGERAPNPLDDPKNRRALIRAVEVMRKAHPEQGAILRRGAVVSLMTHFEALVADLIHAFYATYPAALPAEERTLTLAQLRTLGSIDEAQAFLVSQEVDSVLREALDRQFDYFTKRPKVDLSPLAPYRTDVLETDQRRNLYVHNRGVVNKRYLERVDKALVQKMGAQEGKALESFDSYLGPAIDRALMAGIALGQLCWRKWRPLEAGDADSQLLDAIYQELLSKRYDLVMELAKFAESLNLLDEENRKIVVVNHAIALRDTGRKDELDALLSETDWTACSLRFRVALHMIRNKHDEAIKALRKGVAADEIHAWELREWPLFQPLRDQAEFASLFAELFPGEPLHEPPLLDAPDAEGEGGLESER